MKIIASRHTNNWYCPDFISTEGSSCIIIDGQPIVNALGKPSEAKTFGDLEDMFVKSVLRAGPNYNITYVIFFYRYKEHSIKSGRRLHRTRLAQPFRLIIENGNVLLPNN